MLARRFLRIWPRFDFARYRVLRTSAQFLQLSRNVIWSRSKWYRSHFPPNALKSRVSPWVSQQFRLARAFCNGSIIASAHSRGNSDAEAFGIIYASRGSWSFCMYTAPQKSLKESEIVSFSSCIYAYVLHIYIHYSLTRVHELIYIRITVSHTSRYQRIFNVAL